MSYTVYGLRLKGDREPRYIGMTRQPESCRLQRHYSFSKDRHNPLSCWLRDNRGSIEAFRIADTDDYEVAKAAERMAITLTVALGQRLFNRAHMPTGSIA